MWQYLAAYGVMKAADRFLASRQNPQPNAPQLTQTAGAPVDPLAMQLEPSIDAATREGIRRALAHGGAADCDGLEVQLLRAGCPRAAALFQRRAYELRTLEGQRIAAAKAEEARVAKMNAEIDARVKAEIEALKNAVQTVPAKVAEAAEVATSKNPLKRKAKAQTAPAELAPSATQPVVMMAQDEIDMAKVVLQKSATMATPANGKGIMPRNPMKVEQSEKAVQ